MKPLKIHFIFVLITLSISLSMFGQNSPVRNPRLLTPENNVETRKPVAVLPSKKVPPPIKIDSSSLSIKRDYEVINSMIVNPDALVQLDNYIYSSISKGAMPGCQIVALKNGQVILEKSYGTFNFNNKDFVKNDHLYDIASITKIASTTLAIMKLFEEGKVLLNGNLSAYIPETIGTNKANLKISDLLTHQAGLKSWIPFYKYTIDPVTKRPLSRFYSTKESPQYSIPVANGWYANDRLIDTVWQIILASPLENKGRYVYSDLDLLLLEKVVENLTGMSLDIYMNRFFYRPMGLQNITYNPWEKGLTQKCAPTEQDNYFRHQLVRGYVHDQGAAMIGGVAGHAGLFSNAMDVAALMQLLIDGGIYNGKRYLKKETIELFTGYRSNISRRGYGFDKPEKKQGDGGPAADICSKSTFGHQGFTGTCAWADPQTGIVFILLANRVYPSAENKLFANSGVRTEAQKYIYKSLGY